MFPRIVVPWTGALALVLPLLLASCTANRQLKITEVGAGTVELYLHEPPNNVLALSDHVLEFQSTEAGGANPEQGEVELIGSLNAGEFIVVWEEPNHVGGPTMTNYTNFNGQSVLGIAVAPGTFGTVDNARSYSFRISARRNRYIFPFFYATDVTDDVVMFGPQPRPAIGGTFSEDGSLVMVERIPAQQLSRGRTVWRRTRSPQGIEEPRDTDQESDWREDDESYGTFR